MSAQNQQQGSNEDEVLSEEELYNHVLTLVDIVGPEPHELDEEELTRVDSIGKHLAGSALRLRAAKRGEQGDD